MTTKIIWRFCLTGALANNQRDNVPAEQGNWVHNAAKTLPRKTIDLKMHNIIYKNDKIDSQCIFEAVRSSHIVLITGTKSLAIVCTT